MQRHLQHRSRADRVAGTVAEIQLRRLQARTRTEEGGAAKERVRTQPGLPWRLRAKGAKRAKPAEIACGASGCCSSAAPCGQRPTADATGQMAALGIGLECRPRCGATGRGAAPACGAGALAGTRLVQGRQRSPCWEMGLHWMRQAGRRQLQGRCPGSHTLRCGSLGGPCGVSRAAGARWCPRVQALRAAHHGPAREPSKPCEMPGRQPPQGGTTLAGG